jgi:protein-tyrosine-phosphatase
MAEAMLRHLSNGTIEAYSAGCSPAARIHPLAIRALEAVGIDMYEQYPKHLDHYRRQHFDAIVTLCDWIQEVCPTFPDNPVHIHWSFPDPAKASGSDEEQYAVFKQTGLQLTPRLRLLMTVLNRKHQQKI